MPSSLVGKARRGAAALQSRFWLLGINERLVRGGREARVARAKRARRFVEPSLRARLRGSGRGFHILFDRMLGLLVESWAPSTRRRITEAILEVQHDPSGFSHVTSDLGRLVAGAPPDSTIPESWLMLRYAFAYHGFLEVAWRCRQQAYLSVSAEAARSTHLRAVAIAAFLAADQGRWKDATALRDLLWRLEQGPHHAAELPLILAMFLGEQGTVDELAQSRAGHDHQLMQRIIGGSSVAVVGPAPTMATQGEEIDAFDVVARPSYLGRQSLPGPETSGSRTDVSYYRRPDASFDSFRGPDGRVILPRSLRIAVVESGAEHEFTGVPIRRGFAPSSLGIFGTKASKYQKMQFALYDLLHFSPAKVKLFNTTLYVSDVPYHENFPGPRSIARSRISACAGFARHDPVGQFNFTRHLVSGMGIAVDAALRRVLDLSPEEFVRELDTIYGCGTWHLSRTA